MAKDFHKMEGITSLNSLEDEPSMEETRVIGSFVSEIEEELELIKAPIFNFNMDEYVCVGACT
ncbi:hypothetical protein ISN45_At01g046920 [Arabidopsis thaliana x Arabidopsis arenosa]|uniref:Uncharacterized protein n=2 Tax=Arabidopsis TaxID=3701 RepID=A0A8T2HC83_ARASU|nr:hypothetical protein ISN45_At01g046920 [Arabidopsis thaliana x Arabidopsis arenosa]KAG7657525.1 hypothetical protein ISN44_As01g045900 [Arabidopsis suecica]